MESEAPILCLVRRGPTGSTWSIADTPKLRAARLGGASGCVVITLSGARGSEGPCRGNLRELTDGRYRCRNPPFNGTTADDEVAPKTANLFERLEPDGSGCLHSKYSPD